MDKETFELYRGVVSDIFDCGPSDAIEDTDVERLLNALAIYGLLVGRVDREPLPSDGPDYHADHAAWLARQGAAEKVTEPND